MDIKKIKIISICKPRLLHWYFAFCNQEKHGNRQPRQQAHDLVLVTLTFDLSAFLDTEIFPPSVEMLHPVARLLLSLPIIVILLVYYYFSA